LKYEEVFGVLEDEELISRLEPLSFEIKEPSKIIKPSGGGGVVIAS